MFHVKHPHEFEVGVFFVINLLSKLFMENIALLQNNIKIVINFGGNDGISF